MGKQTITLLAADDALGRQLQDAELLKSPKRYLI